MLDFIILSENVVKNGKLFTIKVFDKEIKIIFTNHSISRIDKWQLRIEKVIETLFFPEEVVKGHRERFIAHKRYNDHIIRAVYEYDNETPTIVTVYYPKAFKYFQGGNNFEDKILP